MKIALMTWFHFDNYGTVLQAVCMCRVLRKMGHLVDIIDYFPGDRSLTLPVTADKSSFLREVRERRRALDTSIITRVSGEVFEECRRENLTYTRYCETLTDLERLNEEYDAFLCGSDRIWLSMHFDPHFYLDFVNEPERMVAYAPSIFDTGDIDPDVKEQMGNLISRFVHLSVREEAGRRFLQDAFGRSTQELADPVLLIDADDWEGTLQLPGEEEKHYLFAMFQGKNRTYHDAAARLADRLGLELKILPVHESDMNRPGAITDSVSPIQFAGLIRNADYICTDSYHATLLSVIFQKEFCCFEQFTAREELNMNTRVIHILKAIGLSERLYDKNAPMERYLEKIDYIPANYKLDALKLKSREYLKESLGQVAAAIAGRTAHKHHILQGYRLCSGCGACVAACEKGAVTVTMDERGFYTANVDENLCIQCERCCMVCPFRGEVPAKNIAEGRLLSYRDEEAGMTENASAGGLAGRLAWLLHKQGKSIVGCAYDEDGQHAVHVLIGPDEPEERLEALQGSKYLQSDFGGIWNLLKEQKGPLAIFGTPCQIAGAKRMFSLRDDVVYIEIACSGVPSYLLYEKYRDSFGGRRRMNTETFALTVRYKQLPQSGNFVRVTDGTNEKIISGKRDAFTRMMDSCECFCEACYDCRWRAVSEADLRIGDFQTHKQSVNEMDSSSVICMSERGQQLLNDMMIAGYWEGLHKADILSYLVDHPAHNPSKPVFYDRLLAGLSDDRTSLQKLVNEFVKPVEKQKRWRMQAELAYRVPRERRRLAEIKREPDGGDSEPQS